MPRPASAFAFLLAALGGASAALSPSAAPAQATREPPAAVAIAATPVPLDANDPARTIVGRLEWRGGLALAGSHRRFGGWSGMLVEDGGRRLVLVSDIGDWLPATLAYDGAGRLAGVSDATLGRLQDESGNPMPDGKRADAESLTRLADGRLLVGFEREHRVLVYPAGSEAAGGGLAGRPQRLPDPPGLAEAPDNEGLEALATLPDGRVLAVTENLSAGEGLARAWVGTPSGTASGAAMAWQPLSYRMVPPFRPTGAAALPGGDVVLTERTWNPVQGVRVRVVRVAGGTIAAGAVLEPVELARLIAPVATDNLESIDAAALPDGPIGLWIVSDDNFNPMQRNLLLHFAIVD